MSKLRDMLLSTGLTTKEYYAQDTSDKRKYIEPQGDPDQKIKHPKDPYEANKDEDTVRKECNQWLKSQGWIVKTIFTGSIPLPNGQRATNPNKGAPDCIVFKGKHKVWIEYKRTAGGHTTIYQRDYHYLLRATGDTVLLITSLTMLKNEFKRLNLC